MFGHGNKVKSKLKKQKTTTEKKEAKERKNGKSNRQKHASDSM